MSSQATLVLAVLILSCNPKETAQGPRTDAGLGGAPADGARSTGGTGIGGSTDGGGAGGSGGGSVDAGACFCTYDDPGAGVSNASPISSTWDCYCGADATACARGLDQAIANMKSDTQNCYALAEYPSCGLTVIFDAYYLSWNRSAFDTTNGQLVGVYHNSDTRLGCPVVADGLPLGLGFHSGRLPPVDCAPASCIPSGNCTFPPPCTR